MQVVGRYKLIAYGFSLGGLNELFLTLSVLLNLRALGLNFCNALETVLLLCADAPHRSDDGC
jgi:hypothetical protein